MVRERMVGRSGCQSDGSCVHTDQKNLSREMGFRESYRTLHGERDCKTGGHRKSDLYTASKQIQHSLDKNIRGTNVSLTINQDLIS